MRKPALSAAACILGIAVFHQTAHAQYRFDNWNTDNGLPQNSVESMVQTRDGYLWLTTRDGLVRYDGVRFTAFTKNTAKGLTTSRFYTLFEDSRGVLWIGTDDRGVVRYDGGEFTTLGRETGLPDQWVWAMREDDEGRLLVVTERTIMRLEGGRFAPVASELAAPGWRPQPRGGLSFVDNAGVRVFDRGHFVLRPLPEDLSANDVTQFYEDQHRTVWVVAGSTRLLRYTADGVTEYSLRGLPDPPVSAVLQDRSGGIWIGTSLGGLSLLKDGKLATVRAGRGTSGSRIVSMLEDREGGLWLGTINEGLFRMSRQAITVLGQTAGLSEPNVYPLLQDRGGVIWVGTWGRGLFRYADGRFTAAAGQGPLLSNASVTALLEDRDGNLWVGTNGSGVFRLRNGRLTRFGKADGLGDNAAICILEDRAGSLWFGTREGLTNYRDGVFTAFTTRDGLPHNKVRVLYESRDGVLWIGTLGGLARFSNGVFRTLTDATGFAGDHVRTIHEDADGVIWVGTYDGGLIRFENGRLSRITTRDGLSNNGVFQILEDDNGYFWMGSNLGISRVSRRELNEFARGHRRAVAALAYGKGDGLLTLECNGGAWPSGIRTRSGQLWIPTQQGVAVIDPRAISFNRLAPPVVIESVLRDGEALGRVDAVHLPPDRHDLQIQYTGLSFVRPEYVRFRVRLDGLDPDWHDVGTRRVAYYPQLGPGSYTFRVQAANSDGVWSEQVTALAIVVAAPFWRTWWFTLMTLSIVTGLAVLAVEHRIARLRRRQAEQDAFSRQLIETQEKERSRIAAELHDGLGQTLAVLRNQALVGLKSPENHSRALEQLAEIAKGALGAIGEVRAIAYDLRPLQIDRLGLTGAVETMMTTVAQSSNVEMTASIDSVDGALPYDAQILVYRIVQECLSNIVKHSAATSARIALRAERDWIRVEVTDNGKGFSAATLERPGHSGRGFGLLGIAERARILRAKLTVTSEPGKGTSVSIEVPVTADTQRRR
ncbi:MAG TPA: two-component regulator propeller domain-containing protein [Vicinamibacterales bacterium]|nr:two-component regulator propeller domain-containing protein [Vicinamibacterales bacterium]